MKIKVLWFTHNLFRWCCFSSVYKDYHFVLLIWRCLGIKHEVDFMLKVLLWELLRLKSFYWAEVLICLRNNLHKIFLVIYFLEQSWRKEIYATFRLPTYINVHQLPIVDTAAVLYVARKYLFDLSVDSLFLLFILLCILSKWKHKLNYCLHS